MSRMTWRDEEALRERLARKEQELEETTAALAAERAKREEEHVACKQDRAIAAAALLDKDAAEARAERLADALRTVAHLCGSDADYYRREAKRIAREALGRESRP